MSTVKTLIHVHTDYSYDSSLSLEALMACARREDIGCVAVTDHDTIEGAKRLSSIADFTVIVGEEVTTRDGDLIGLFLKERIRPGMTARDTARAIRDQGGLVLIPHPFLRSFGCGLCDSVWDVIDLADGVEVNNAQNRFSFSDARANRFADQTGLVKFVGSDCHMAGSVAPCYQEMRAFDGPKDFLDALAAAELTRGYHPIHYFAEIARRMALPYVNCPLPAAVGAHSDGRICQERVATLAGSGLRQAAFSN